MNRAIGLAAACLALAFTQPASAQATSERVVSDAQRPVWGSYGDIKVARMTDDKVPGGAHIRVTVPKAGANFWDSSTTGTVPKAIKKGDTVTVAFFARSGEPGKPAWVNAVVGTAQPPFAAAVVGRVNLNDEMRFYCVEGVSPVDVPAGKGRLTLHVAGAQQVIDLGSYVVTARPSGTETQLPCAQTIASTARAN